MKYRKKPVVIEAIQYTGDTYDEIAKFVTVHIIQKTDNTLAIPTLEGEMTASSGDYIIRGVHGEYYPCKPDIFTKTYEVAK